MTAPRRGFTIRQHLIHGFALRSIRTSVEMLAIDAESQFPRNSRPAREARRLLKQLELTRIAFNNAAAESGVYYGLPGEASSPTAKPVRFRNPEVPA